MSESTAIDCVYHVILDVDFSWRNDLLNRAITFGAIRHTIGNQNVLPVCCELTDAQKRAKRIVDSVVDAGTHSGKRFPVIGAVILKLDVSALRRRHVSVETDSAGRDYTDLQDIHPTIDELVVCDFRNGSHRAVVTASGYAKTKITGARIERAINISLHLAFCLYNLVPSLLESDIVTLHRMYRATHDNNDFYPIDYDVYREPEYVADQLLKQAPVHATMIATLPVTSTTMNGGARMTARIARNKADRAKQEYEAMFK